MGKVRSLLESLSGLVEGDAAMRDLERKARAGDTAAQAALQRIKDRLAAGGHDTSRETLRGLSDGWKDSNWTEKDVVELMARALRAPANKAFRNAKHAAGAGPSAALQYSRGGTTWFITATRTGTPSKGVDLTIGPGESAKQQAFFTARDVLRMHAQPMGEADEDARGIERAFAAHPDEAGFRKLVQQWRRTNHGYDEMVVYKVAKMPFWKPAMVSFGNRLVRGVAEQVKKEFEDESISIQNDDPTAVGRLYPDNPQRPGPVEIIVDGPQFDVLAEGHWASDFGNFYAHGASEEVKEILKRNSGLEWRMTSNTSYHGRSREHGEHEHLWTMALKFYRNLDADLLGRIFS